MGIAVVVARGQAEIGFQQIIEWRPIAGIDLVGPLPPEVQKITISSGGIVVGAREPDAAKALITFLACRGSKSERPFRFVPGGG
jgi:molybdate transport system substrate-binding protein